MTTVSEVVSRLRDEVLRDSAEPFLFSTPEIVRVLSEGQKLFARHTHCLHEEFALTTVAGTSKYALDASVCFVRQVLHDGKPLTPYTRSARGAVYSGRPSAYSTDAAQSRVGIYPVPDQAYNLVIDAAVVPPTLSSGSNMAVNDEWIPVIMDYAAYRLLNNNDPDGSAQIAADRFFASWRDGLMLAKSQLIRWRSGDEPRVIPRRWV